MLFNSLEFLLFLPIVFLLYWFIFNKSLKLQNAFIVVVSYIFYGWWDWKFLILIAFTSTCSFYSGLLIEKAKDFSNSNKKNRAKLYTTINAIVNIAILGVFKYFNFFSENFAQLFRLFGFEVDWITLDILLPVGISFYTFQALSYTIDIYRGSIKPTHSIINMFAYISFFPQLVAGPIERATNLLPQFEQKRVFRYDIAIDGCRQMLWGFFKKIVIADLCAIGANNIFAEYTTIDNSLILITGAILFTFQIYGDFSGYSDIAIGCSKLFGIKLMRNFNIPYFSRDIAEFWRRWHISLTTWFRDYIYIPLGGSRGSKLVSLRNTFIIFLISGFWHGANWTYIAWGGYHAMLFIPLLLLNKNRKNKGVVAEGHLLPSVPEILQMIFTFVLVTIGWVIFRAESINQAADYIIRMIPRSLDYPNSITSYVPNINMVICILPIFMLMEWFSRSVEHPFVYTHKYLLKYRFIRWCIYYIFILIIIYNASSVQSFIYFQF